MRTAVLIPAGVLIVTAENCWHSFATATNR
jgi:hypothetical protein